jgi:hypothetical protein
VYTYTSTDQSFDDRDLERVGEIDGLRASVQKDSMMARNKVQLSVHERQEQLVGLLNRKTLNGRENEEDYRTDPLTKLHNYDYNLQYNFQPVVPLPLDARICVAPQAQCRRDLMAVFENTSRMACICFGINGESIGLNAHGNTHASADTIQQANQVTTATVNKFKSLVSPVLVDIYRLIWGTADEVGDNEAEAHPQAKTATDITVVFPSTIPQSMMEKLFVSQVLKYDAYKQYLHESLQIPIADMEKTYSFEEVNGGSAPKPK